ncbi:hypothetical protein N657DRAFT_641661 [Parathielavia appendiculata]|uniref:Uncharacterized protein n=1 Tax=Parathielavia appendiculata TaxID=2587402 RepID=A0AAN6U7G0_9PEZI|nr:hypothetical protein N657DRAFT_641661 [Parathielavia appendiculata]
MIPRLRLIIWHFFPVFVLTLRIYSNKSRRMLRSASSSSLSQLYIPGDPNPAVTM